MKSASLSYLHQYNNKEENNDKEAINMLRISKALNNEENGAYNESPRHECISKRRPERVSAEM